MECCCNILFWLISQSGGRVYGLNVITAAVMIVVQPFIDGFMNIWNNISDGAHFGAQKGGKMIFEGAWEFIKSIGCYFDYHCDPG